LDPVTSLLRLSWPRLGVGGLTAHVLGLAYAPVRVTRMKGPHSWNGQRKNLLSALFVVQTVSLRYIAHLVEGFPIHPQSSSDVKIRYRDAFHHSRSMNECREVLDLMGFLSRKDTQAKVETYLSAIETLRN